jgi:DNA-3-methyladenine glycosylase II
MGLSAAQLKASLDALTKIEPRFGPAIAHVGYPEPRDRPRGYETLLRTIVGQQVSFKAAAAVWNKLEAARGDLTNPDSVLTASFDELRACGLSRQSRAMPAALLS